MNKRNVQGGRHIKAAGWSLILFQGATPFTCPAPYGIFHFARAGEPARWKKTASCDGTFEPSQKIQTSASQTPRVKSWPNHVNGDLIVVFIFESIVATTVGKNFACLPVTNNKTLPSLVFFFEPQQPNPFTRKFVCVWLDRLLHVYGAPWLDFPSTISVWPSSCRLLLHICTDQWMRKCSAESWSNEGMKKMYFFVIVKFKVKEKKCIFFQRHDGHERKNLSFDYHLGCFYFGYQSILLWSQYEVVKCQKAESH